MLAKRLRSLAVSSLTGMPVHSLRTSVTVAGVTSSGCPLSMSSGVAVWITMRRAGFVQQIKRFVRQAAIVNIAIGEPHGGFARFRRNRDLVMFFVTLVDVFDHDQRLRDTLLIDVNRAETAVEGRVFGDSFAVFLVSRRANAGNLPAGQRRFEDVGRVEIAVDGVARADDGVNLVDEEDHFGRAFDLVHNADDAFFELPAQTGTRHQHPDLQPDDAPAEQEFGGGPVRDVIRQPFDYGGFTHAGIAEQQRVILLIAAQGARHHADLALAPDGRADLAFVGLLGQVAPVFIEQRSRHAALTAFGLARIRRRIQVLEQKIVDFLVIVVFFDDVQQALDPVAQIHTLRGKDARRDAFAFLQQREQDVFLTDEAFPGVIGQVDGHGQHTAAARRERRPFADGIIPATHFTADQVADITRLKARFDQHSGGGTARELGQAVEEMFCPDVVVAQSRRFFDCAFEQWPAALTDFLFANVEGRQGHGVFFPPHN